MLRHLMLYDHDYSKLEEEEKIKFQEYLGRRSIYSSYSEGVDLDAVTSGGYTKKIRYYMSLFPNNFIPEGFRENSYIDDLATSFEHLINNEECGEREILNHIKKNRHWEIIGSIFSSYNFGHHSAFIFPEFRLGTEFVVDYLLVGKNSGGHYLVFVELESPYGAVTQKTGKLGHVIRKGVSQVDDWKFWLEQNYSQIGQTLKKYKTLDTVMPEELFKYDSSRMNYCVVAGRRQHYNEQTYLERRLLKENQKTLLLHYDNLIDRTRRFYTSPSR